MNRVGSWCNFFYLFNFILVFDYTANNELYYGEVNDDMVPHGVGLKVYPDAKLIEANWYKGTQLNGR